MSAPPSLRRSGTPSSWTKLSTIDAHTAGEPLRLFLRGFPEPEGHTMLEKRNHALEHMDHLRRALMLEPRGHRDMYGCLMTRPVTKDGHFGVLFTHNDGQSTMCGHGIIAVVKIGLECGLFQTRDGVVRIDTPAGRVTATPELGPDSSAGCRVKRVSFENVPSFLLKRDLRVRVSGLPDVVCDVAFGGAFYAYVDASTLGLTHEDTRTLVDVGMRIKRAVASAYSVEHPSDDPAMNFIYGTIFVWKNPDGSQIHSRNVCIFANGEIDRSPTGTGVSGRAAIAHARGELALGSSMTIESIIGTQFDVCPIRSATVGALPAIIPRVTGSAHITGRHEFTLDPGDPLRHGFFLA